MSILGHHELIWPEIWIFVEKFIKPNCQYHDEEARKKKRQQAEVWNEDDIPKALRNEL